MDAAPADPALADGRTLRLDSALALLRQAGQAEPSAEPGSPAYLQALIDQLVDLSSRDALTGLANRRNFELALAREVDRVARSGESALLLMVAKGLKMERAYGDTNECGYAQWAAFCDRQFVLGMLVAQGHDFLRPDKLEQTPWDHAVENWSLLSIKLLLDFSDRPLKTCYFLHGSTRFQALQLVPDNPRTPADRLESRHIPGRLAHIGRVRRRVYDSVWQTLAQPDPIAALRDGFCYTWYRDNLAQGYWWRVYIFAVQALVCHVLVLAFTCADHGAFPAVYLLAAALLAGANLLLAFKFGTSR